MHERFTRTTKLSVMPSNRDTHTKIISCLHPTWVFIHCPHQTSCTSSPVTNRTNTPMYLGTLLHFLPHI